MGIFSWDSCNDKCKTCDPNNKNICYSCKDTNKYAYKEDCINSCPQKTFPYLKEDNFKICIDCYVNCASCDGEGEAQDMKCLTCSNNKIKYQQNCFEISDNKIKSFKNPEYTWKITSCLELYSKYIIENTYECIDKPAKGYYVSNPTTGLLSPCHPDCETCSKNYTSLNTNCDSCSNPALYLQNGNCVNSCSLGYYQEGKKCIIECHKNCLTCETGMLSDSNGTLLNMKCNSCNNYFNINSQTINKDLETIPNSAEKEPVKIFPKYIKNDDNCFPIIINDKTKIIFDISEIYQETPNGTCLFFNKAIYAGKTECISKPDNTYYVLNNSDNTGVINNCSVVCNTCLGENTTLTTNCIECAKDYYKTQDSKTNCISKDLIPINYYFNSSDYIYYKCHENCYNCTNGYISDNMNCITCKHNYYFIYGDNKSNCYDKTLINNGYYNNCLTCDNENNLYMLEDLNNCEFSNYTGYYLDNNTFILKRCYTTCKTCNGPYENNTLLNFENHNCILCAENYYKLSNGSFPNNCYDKVIIDLWSKEFFTTNEIVKIITTDMLKEGTTYKIIEEGIINIEKEETNKTLDDIITNITDIMKDKELGVNYEIKGDNFTIVIKPTNSPPLPNTTHVDFDDCEKILRKEYNISNTSIITFFQMEINNDDKNALYNQIKYTTYDEQLQELDLSLCKDVETQIHYALKDDSNLNLNTVSNFKKLGVDILNIKDEFFTNLCYSYSDSNKDMVLEDRIKYIFQNYSLCEEGCTYNNMDLEQNTILCDCKIQGQGNISTVTTTLSFDSGKETSFLDSNIGVIKCYNIVFSLSNKKDNIGFIAFSFLFLVYIIFFLIQIIKGIKPVINFLYNEMINYGYLNKDDPKFFENKQFKKVEKYEISSIFGMKNMKEDLNKEININNLDNEIITKKLVKRKKIKRKKKSKAKTMLINNMNTIIEDNDNNSKILKRKKIINYKQHKIKEEKINEDNNFGIIKINLNSDLKDYFPGNSNQSLHNYTFDEAIKYDRRNIFRVFYIYLLSKQIIFRTFLQRSPLELFPLRFTLFIFILSCDLALNALFYFNDNISKKYQYAQSLFLFTFSNNITIIIYSTLISSVLMTFLTKLTHSSNAIRNVFRKEEEKIRGSKKYKTSEETKRNIFYDIKNILKNFKIKIIFLFIIETVFILFFWYFVTAFCHVYSNTQTSWLLDSFLSILSRLFIELIFALLFAKLYRISVASNMETLYKIVFCLYDIC